MKAIFASAILAVLSIAPGAAIASVSAAAAAVAARIGRCPARIGMLHPACLASAFNVYALA